MLNRIRSSFLLLMTTTAGLTLGARAAHAEGEAIPLPLTFEALEWDCSSRCIATGSDGALLCLSGGESLACDDCSAAWIAPDTKASKGVAWKSLQSCGQMQAKKNKANLAAINGRGKKSSPLESTLTAGPFGATTPSMRSTSGDLEMVVDPTTIRLSRGGALVGVIAWPDEVKPQDGELVTALAYPLGAGFVVALVAKNPDMVVQRTVWVVVSAAAATKSGPVALPLDASDAAIVAAMRPYLDRFCLGTLSADDLAALRAGAKAGSVSPRALVVLFNVYGAFYGYTFKAEKWLNDVYYSGNTWGLPDSCKNQIRAYPSQSKVPAALGKLRDDVKAIWNETK